MKKNSFNIRIATEEDIPQIFSFIKDLAEYEKLSHEVVATEELLNESLFGSRKVAEVIIGYFEEIPIGFALYFHNFSTFLGRPGIFLEDLFVKQEYRGRGYGKALLIHLAQITKERNCGRLEWNVLDWNTPAINFYKSIGANILEEWETFRLTGNSLDTVADM